MPPSNFRCGKKSKKQKANWHNRPAAPPPSATHRCAGWVHLVCLVQSHKPNRLDTQEKPVASCEPLLSTSPSRLTFLVTESLRWGVRLLSHCVLLEASQIAPRHAGGTSSSPSHKPSFSRSINRIQKRCARFNRSNNRHFSCFVYDLLYDECNHQLNIHKRTTLRWKTRTTSPPPLTLPGFRLLP